MKSDIDLAKQIAGGILGFLRKIRKEGLLTNVIEILQKEKDSKKALVYTPTQLNHSEKKKISKMISGLTGDTIDSFIFQKDESLIDGLKIFYKDRLWDFSMSGQIKKIANKE